MLSFRLLLTLKISRLFIAKQSSMDHPLVNSWTEWGDLETVMVGSAANMAYPEWDPFGAYNVVQDDFLGKYMSVVGPRPKERIARAQNELANLCHLLKAEQVAITTVSEFDEDTKQHLARKRSSIKTANGLREDVRVSKKVIDVCRSPEATFDHLLLTPWFKSYYQFGLACPRDVLITLGNTILETPTASRARYFESAYYRNFIYKLWDADKRVLWKKAPPATCQDAMFDLSYFDKGVDDALQKFAKSGYKTALNETEVAFDAADMMRVGKDVFYKKDSTANNRGIQWLRREFPHLRFHAMHFPTDFGPHLDVNLIPLRPPTSGSEGIVLISRDYPPLASEMKIFTDNNWKPYYAPAANTELLSPVAVCSSSLNMNLLSISPKCCIIEECETKMYDFLTDLGFDVITCPLRTLNEFGGGVHCVTWDIKRNDECKDYLPDQDYEKECAVDLNEFYDSKVYDSDMLICNGK